jgi:hypothetical protein
MEIAAGLWLTASPVGVALAPPSGRGDRLQTALGLALELRLDSPVPKAAAKRPLPPLQQWLPRGGGARFDLALALDYAALGDALGQQLSEQSLEVEGRQVQVAKVGLGTKGGDLVVSARLNGEAPGRLTIMGRPAWDTATGAVRLADLGFVFDADDPEQGLAAGLWYERIQSVLERAANDLLRVRTGKVRDGLQAALTRTLGPALPVGAQVALSDLALRDLKIEIGDAGLRLKGSAGGDLRISVGQGAGK